MSRRSFIYCIVDPQDNSYDYETDGMWCDNLDTRDAWFRAGVKSVVCLDALSMELICTINNND